MTPLLTTITPYWDRPEMLRGWVKAMRGASISGLWHIIHFVREHPPQWWADETAGLPIGTLIHLFDPPGLSIGHYHNFGANASISPWMMKIDIDTLPHVNFFRELLPVLVNAKEREWFNVGMVNVDKKASQHYLADDRLPVSVDTYQMLVQFAGPPVATNFVCRTKEYLELGGCDKGFRGYGWEDYQQIYMLERHWLGKCPLPGEINEHNVTNRCREDISRKKARELAASNSLLCLLHRWHPRLTNDPDYRSSMDENKKILLQFINKSRTT